MAISMSSSPICANLKAAHLVWAAMLLSHWPMLSMSDKQSEAAFSCPFVLYLLPAEKYAKFHFLSLEVAKFRDPKYNIIYIRMAAL